MMRWFTLIVGLLFLSPAHAQVLPDLPDELEQASSRLDELEGVLTVYHEDYDDHSQFAYWLDTPTERVELAFPDDHPHWLSGSRIRSRGLRVNHRLAVESNADVTPLLLATPLVSGAQNTVVILVNFSDKAATFTPEAIRSLVFTTVSAFDQENSYNQAWLTGTVVGPLTIALTSVVCDYQTLASQAKTVAMNTGISLIGYTRYVYVFPKNACGWWGLGTVGGNPSQAWINDNPQLRVVAHELGHNFGLYHSHSLDCGTEVVIPPCATSEYGDTTDVMGTSYGHFNAVQKERLGWLSVLSVLNSGQYVLDAYEPLGGTSKALKVLKSTDPQTGKKTWYYVEFRQPIGFDSWISTNPNLTQGVVVHMGTETSSNSSYLLDMTPITTSWADPALTVGKTFRDSTAGVVLTTQAVNQVSHQALVDISISTVDTPCTHANPLVSLSPTSMSVALGTVATYTISVTNQDSVDCANASFWVQGNAPPSFKASISPSTMNLGPGQTATATFSMTIPKRKHVIGSYTIQASVTNSEFSPYVGSDISLLQVLASP